MIYLNNLENSCYYNARHQWLAFNLPAWILAGMILLCSLQVNAGKLNGGESHTIRVCSGGSLYAWGLNDQGQLGDGTQTNTLIPKEIQGLAGFTAVAAGSRHTLALRSDGTVWSWGNNDNGQLGNGNNALQLTPQQIQGLANVIAVFARGSNSAAIDQSGNVWIWGANTNGQLGDGTLNDANTPQQVSTLTGMVISQVALGDGHVLILNGNGEVWSCGNNDLGQLGLGDTTDRLQPQQVSSLSTVTYIAAGDKHSIAIDSNGDVWTWGSNEKGQLGISGNNIDFKKTPQSVTGFSNQPAIKATAGEKHSILLLADGSVWVWGSNAYGQVGNGAQAQKYNSPVNNSNLQFVIDIAAGANHSMAILQDSSLTVWGDNSAGQIGDGTTNNSNLPVTISMPCVSCQQPVAQFGSDSLGAYTYQFSSSSIDANEWLWEFGDGNTSTLESPQHTYANTGNYQVCLTALNTLNGCSETDKVCASFDVVCGLPVASFTTSSAELDVDFVNSSTGAQSWSWEFGDGQTSNQQTPHHRFNNEGEFQVCLTAENDCGTTKTCQTVLVCSNDCVWPGDVNKDGFADVRDLVYIGVGFGKTGPVRPNAITDWTGQPAADWAFDFPDDDGNFKHGDTNGDGVIDYMDTTALGLNYGFTANGRPQKLPPKGNREWFRFNTDSFQSISSGTNHYRAEISVSLDQIAYLKDSVYGVALFLTYKPEKEWEVVSIDVKFDNSAAGAPNELVYLHKWFPNKRFIDIGIARKDGQPIASTGIICTLIVEVDNIEGGGGGQGNGGGDHRSGAEIKMEEQLNLEFGSANLYDKNAELAFESVTNTGSPINWDNRIIVYPNPTSGNVTILPVVPYEAEVTISDAMGRIICKHIMGANMQWEVDLTDYAKGFYIVSAKSAGRIRTEKILLIGQ